MAVPEFKAFLLPTLQWYGDDKEHKLAELDAPLSDHFGLSEEDRNEMLESGTQTRLHNRVAWAHVYLAKAKLLDRIARSRYRITDRGQQLLASKPAEITPAFLRDTYPEFEEFATPTKPAGDAGEKAKKVSDTFVDRCRPTAWPMASSMPRLVSAR